MSRRRGSNPLPTAWKAGAKIKENILQTAILDGPYVTQWFEEEPGAGGKNQVAELTELIRKNLPNWPTPTSWRPEGDKIMRANVWFAEAQNGHIFLIEGSWNKPFLDQLSSFPIGRHDDRIDSISGARHTIAPIRTWKQISYLSL